MSDKAQEHLQNGLLVSAVLEATRDSASRAQTTWGRIGVFAVTFVAATLTSVGISAVVNWFSGKRHAKPAESQTPQAPCGLMTVAGTDQGKSNWAQDVSEKKHTCGCHLSK